jgi:hypothetical protein
LKKGRPKIKGENSPFLNFLEKFDSMFIVFLFSKIVFFSFSFSLSISLSFSFSFSLSLFFSLHKFEFKLRSIIFFSFSFSLSLLFENFDIFEDILIDVSFSF